MSRSRLLSSFSWLALAGIAVAHHLHLPLSASCCEGMLGKVVYKLSGPAKGTVPYHAGTDEHHIHGLDQGHGFTVVDQDGTAETVVLGGSPEQEPQDVADALNAQLTVARAEVHNSVLFLRGTTGGDSSSLTLFEGDGNVLGLLGLQSGTEHGTTDIELTLSIPTGDGEHEHDADHAGPHLAGHPYVVAASVTPGVIDLGDGVSVGLGFDQTTEWFLRATAAGVLPGFTGTLDLDGHAQAVIPEPLLAKLFPAGMPERLDLAFVVFSQDLSEVAFASNVFSVEFED